jgi:hypothetical protein
VTTTDARHRVVRVLGSFARWLRDGWLVVGVALLMLVSLEAAYRIQAAAREAVASRGRGPKHPFADSAWFPAYRREFRSTVTETWAPYVSVRRNPFAGSLINIDSARHRRTIPGPHRAADTIRVFALGGSTMWGTDLRDQATIPSVLSRLPASKAPAGLTFDVTNFGESGRVFHARDGGARAPTARRLRAEHRHLLRRDQRRRIGGAIWTGRSAMNEVNRPRDFQLGRVIYGPETDLRSDAYGPITAFAPRDRRSAAAHGPSSPAGRATPSRSASAHRPRSDSLSRSGAVRRRTFRRAACRPCRPACH